MNAKDFSIYPPLTLTVSVSLNMLLGDWWNRDTPPPQAALHQPLREVSAALLLSLLTKSLDGFRDLMGLSLLNDQSHSERFHLGEQGWRCTAHAHALDALAPTIGETRVSTGRHHPAPNPG